MSLTTARLKFNKFRKKRGNLITALGKAEKDLYICIDMV